MKFQKINILLLLLFFLFIRSKCKRDTQNLQLNPNAVKNPLIEINKSKVAMESQQIDAYVKRRKWKVIKTGTGLRYFIYKNGTGKKAETGMYAKIKFDLHLLNGDLAYTTKETGSTEFLIGMDNVESGLHEGITYMHVGDKAQMILPSHLAYGLIGDSKKIPARTSIVYDIELLALRPNK